MKQERVLVTGATGFTGGHLCDKLIADGYSVRALVRDPNRCTRLSGLGVQLAVGDLRDMRSLEQAVDGVDTVYHIAASFRSEKISRGEMWETNVQGTETLLDASVRAGVRRFVHCSTVGVHGDIKDPPANEEAPYAPGDYYQKSKTEGERIVLKYMGDGRLPIVVFRPGGIYGPRDLRFLKLIKSIMKRIFVMLGPGEVSYHMIYIDDLVDGILQCGICPGAVGNVYILTGKQATTLNELVKTIAQVLGVPPPRLRFPVTPVYVLGYLCELACRPFGINPPLYRRRVDFFRKNRAFDISKAKGQLGFSPETELSTGIQLTVDWYRSNGYL